VDAVTEQEEGTTEVAKVVTEVAEEAGAEVAAEEAETVEE
jgi:hypothetical protein